MLVQAAATAPKPVSPFSPAHYLTWGAISLATLGVSAALPSQAPLFGPLFLLASTVSGYLLGVALPAPIKAAFHPIIVCGLYGSVCCKLLAWVSGVGYHEVLSTYMYKVSLLFVLYFRRQGALYCDTLHVLIPLAQWRERAGATKGGGGCVCRGAAYLELAPR